MLEARLLGVVRRGRRPDGRGLGRVEVPGQDDVGLARGEPLPQDLGVPTARPRIVTSCPAICVALVASIRLSAGVDPTNWEANATRRSRLTVVARATVPLRS